MHASWCWPCEVGGPPTELFFSLIMYTATCATSCDVCAVAEPHPLDGQQQPAADAADVSACSAVAERCSRNSQLECHHRYHTVTDVTPANIGGKLGLPPAGATGPEVRTLDAAIQCSRLEALLHRKDWQDARQGQIGTAAAGQRLLRERT